MLYFENVRRSLNKNQQEMAEACGIGRSTWQLIEYGALLPSRTVADIIRELTGVVVPCEDQCLKAAERRKWRRQRPYEFGAADADMWTRVHRHCESMTGLYESIGPAQVAWMEQLLQIGSVTEGFHLLQLAHQGGKPFLDSPHELGYRTQPLVDAQGLVLGERRLPGCEGCLEMSDTCSGRRSASGLAWPLFVWMRSCFFLGKAALSGAAKKLTDRCTMRNKTGSGERR